MADVYELFTDPLAQAIAEGRKTVTRRPITARNSVVSVWHKPAVGIVAKEFITSIQESSLSWALDGSVVMRCSTLRVSPRGQVGDTLIVRETWQRLSFPDGWIVVHRAGYGPGHSHWHESIKPKWRPSIHMKRSAARSVRRITSVWPELLGPLDQAEAEREGFESPEEFAAAWTGIYGDKVRWVWRIEFEARNEA